MLARRLYLKRAALMALLLVSAVTADEGPDKAGTLHDDFESARTAWRREETDATIRLLAHDRSNRAAHDGRLSEHFRFEAGPGSGFYFSYALPKIPVNDRLTVGLYVRSNRAGVQLKGRVVLPSDTDPDTGEPSFVLVQGPLYENGERWQKLQMLDIRREAERQARILRASTKRPVLLDGAYLDRLVVNLYGGAGESEVFLDDLTITPVPASTGTATVGLPVPEPSLPRAGQPANGGSAPPNNLSVQLVRNRLSRDGHPWVFTAIHAPGADVAALGRAGFDVLADDLDANPKRIEKAIATGMKLMPLMGGAELGEVADPGQVARLAELYPYREAVAFWHLGGGLGRAPLAKDRRNELERVRNSVVALQRAQGNFSRLTTAEVEGETFLFARPPRNLDAIGVRPIAWGSLHQPYETSAYLAQRRVLASANPGQLFWTWISARPPDVLVPTIWGEGKVPDWGYPRVQPEQLRLYTYLALAAGYRGIGYLADASLTSDAGQAQLIEMELLNEEIDLFESIIATGSDPYPQYAAYLPDPAMPKAGTTRIGQRTPVTPELMPHSSIRATAIGTHDRKGVLLVMYDMSNFSQFQPPQMAEKEVWLTVIAPEGAQAFEFSPGGMRVLETKRVPGGRRIKVEDFAVSSLILMTTDFDLPGQIEARINQNRSVAVQLAIRQAQLQYEWVMGIDEKLAQADHGIKEAPEMFAVTSKTIDDARAYLEREDYLNAWTEARRAGRGLRHLMRGHWERAMEQLVKTTDFGEKPAPVTASREPASAKKKPKVAGLTAPSTSSPASVAFNTLPQHFRLLDWLKNKSFSRNLVPSGSFDDPHSLDEELWTPQNYEYEGVTGKVFLTSATAYRDKGKAIRMTVGPTDPEAGVDKLPPFFDFPPVAIRSPALPVTAEYLYRISVLVKSPLNSVAGMGGVIIRDSIGGEALQYRTSDKVTDWTRVVVYRRAPEDGSLTVTLGLAAYGDVYFDDFRVEQVQERPRTVSPDVAVAPGGRGETDAPSSATRSRTPDRTSR
ncbi:MAG: hypothetical protein P4L84_38005 [Isosphaeraceae bacterium]|nr:hypothetical protein [Isosphaeraceae bacterium]